MHIVYHSKVELAWKILVHGRNPEIRESMGKAWSRGGLEVVERTLLLTGGM
jgi:hypothetical protein